MTEQEKMLSGQLYFAGVPELLAARKRAKEMCQRFNRTAVQDPEAGTDLLRELLGRGTLWGAALPGDLPPVLLAAAPCGGLLLLACLAALIRWASARLERREKP